MSGQRVQAGQVLARLSPTIPVADLGTMQQLRAEVAGKLKVAEQKLSRLSRISTVVAQSDIEDTRAELEALREQRRVLEEKDIEKFELKAPVSGVISVANVRAGQVVSGRDTLFEILDPDRLWVEAAGADIHGDDDIAGGVAYDADGHTLSLAYIGRSPTLRQQSQSLLVPADGTAHGAGGRRLGYGGRAAIGERYGHHSRRGCGGARGEWFAAGLGEDRARSSSSRCW